MLKIGICILAGGLSTRMGRPKAQMRLGHRTLLGHVRRIAKQVTHQVRVIRRDLIPRCGPLGGVYTALKTSSHDGELFLSCDMPFVTPELLRQLEQTAPPVFVEHRRTVGFPFMLSVSNLNTVEQQIRSGRFSLQHLAKGLKAHRLRLKGQGTRQLFNVNTPADLGEALRHRAELPL